MNYSSNILFKMALLAFFGMHLVVQPTGLHMVNQTNQKLRYRMTTAARDYSGDLNPGQSYYFSHAPNNMTIYSPQGSCSEFYDIWMNGTVFNTLLIRHQKSAPGCHVIGYTGRTRQRNSVTIPPVPFESNYCRRGCWNPATGTITPISSTGVLSGTQPYPFPVGGTDMSYYRQN